jgi:radical SAM superfamily enzyme YgiQ (UPF0313 family)
MVKACYSFAMRYEGNIFRPFSEANSYLLQCTIGCSHNQCTFCGMYKDKSFRLRSLEEIFTDIRMAKEAYSDLEKVFLCDGDAIAIETEQLLQIIGELFRNFPSLRHVASYVGPRSTLKKGLADLITLREAGLTKAYLGLETGDEQTLKEIKKGVTYGQMLEAGKLLIDAGMNLSAMILLGIAGPGARSTEHALATAKICNEIKPHYLAGLTYTPVPGTVLFRKIEDGQFELIDPFDTLAEMKIIIENLAVDGLKFVGTHASNYLPITGTLPQDKAKMVGLIDSVLEKRDMRYLRSERMRGL